MLQVLVAGVIALGSKWLLEGGLRRRDRHVIREELELAEILGDRPEADRLRASAERRLQRYLRPTLVKRTINLVDGSWWVSFAVGMIGVAVLPLAKLDVVELFALAAAIGLASAVVGEVTQWLITRNRAVEDGISE